MRRWTGEDFPGAAIDADASIEGERVSVGAGVRIDAGVRIEAREIEIGPGAVIERGTIVRGLGATMERFTLGDRAFLGFENQILAPEFAMGDYGQIHNGGLHSGYKPLTLGHNNWVGQSAILNCTERLTIGENVRIGTGSQLWTHVASGELLEGCTLYGENPLTLEDNVWIVGGAVISPGLTLGRNAIIMTGSVLTKSAEPFHTYAGVPAKDVTDKLNFWRPMALTDKLAAVRGYVEEFRKADPGNGARVALVETAGDLDAGEGDVVIAGAVHDWSAARSAGVSLFDLTTKKYLKQRSEAEIAWIRFTVGFRARFVPLGG